MILNNIMFYRKKDKVNISIYCYIHKGVYCNYEYDEYKIYLNYNIKNGYKISGEIRYTDADKNLKEALYIKLTLNNKDGKTIRGNEIRFIDTPISKITRNKIKDKLSNAGLVSIINDNELIEYKILYNEYITNLLNVKNIMQCCYGI